MSDSIQNYSTSKYDDAQLGQIVDAMMMAAKDSRRNFERKNYDNNFFDDGYHFRYLSRSQNKIIDLSEKANLWAPMRAIPKASRQIRGMVNLLVSQDFIPVIYPEKVSKGTSNEQPQLQTQGMGQDPNQGMQTGQQPDQYKIAMDKNKMIARKTGHWIEEFFKQEEILEQKIPHMGILTAKHGISYLKIYPDPVEEQIRTTVRDFFDIYVMGSLTETKDSPFMGEGVPRSIAEIKADERFDPDATKRISADNKHASSEIKDAYMRANYGGEMANAEYVSTLIQKEFFIKEYLNDENVPRIRKQEKGDDILRRHTSSDGKLKYGDPVFRQVFVAGNVTLAPSQYVNLPDYPYVDLRFEPGPIYQVPLIERFIPANKSLDMVVSRVERLLHTMVTGSWSIKTGEPAEPTNTAGGQILKYRTTPPIQNTITNIPPFVENFMGLLNSYITEQGTTLSTLGQVPSGVKAHAAIESLKESEYANLVINTKQLKKTMKRITERSLDIADDYFVTPQTVYHTEDGDPQYFDIIGSSGLKKRQDLNLTKDLTGEEIPIKRDYRCDIEIQAGLGYTREGKKAAAKELGDYLIQLAQLKLVSPEVVKIFFKTLLEEYSFGPTEDIMEAMENANAIPQVTEDQLLQMKIAILEALKEAGEIGPEAQKNRILENKVGAMEALQDAGLTDPKPAPVDPLKQMETQQKLKIQDQQNQMKLAQASQDMQIKADDAKQDQAIQAATASHDMMVKDKLADAQAKNMQNQPKGGKNGSSK